MAKTKGKAKRENGAKPKSRDYHAGFMAGVAHASEAQKHEGWSNYYTWAVALYLDNDRKSYHYWRVKADEARAFARMALDPDMAKVHLSNALHDELYDSMPGLGRDSHTFWADLLSCARGEIHFGEIAQHLLEE